MGNGEDIRAWQDAWIPRTSFFNCIRCTSDVPEDLRVPDFITAEREWNAKLIHQYCAAEDARLILNIPLSEHDLPNQLMWSSSSSGRYTLKEGYYVAWRFLKQQ